MATTRINNTGLKIGVSVGVGILFLVVTTLGFYYVLTSKFPGADDFYARWRPTRAWLFEGLSPYAPAVAIETQTGIYGRPAKPGEDINLFYYPMFSVIFFAPFALISSYAWASAAWLSVVLSSLISLLVLSLAWARWRPPLWVFALTLLFGILWYHTVRTLILGQFAAVEALIILAALLAARSGHDEWAGILLALSATKTQMAFLVIPGLLLWALSLKRWKLIGWFTGAMAALLVLSFVLLPSWLTEWLNELPRYVDNTTIGSPISIVVRYLLPPSLAWVEQVLNAAFLLYLLWEWWRARGQTGPQFDWAVAMTLLVTNLISVRTATTNYIMMLPALFLIFRVAQERWGNWGLPAVAVSEISLFVGIWILFASTVKGNLEQPPPYLPFPLLLLVGLLWIRATWPPTPAAPVAPALAS